MVFLQKNTSQKPIDQENLYLGIVDPINEMPTYFKFEEKFNLTSGFNACLQQAFLHLN